MLQDLVPDHHTVRLLYHADEFLLQVRTNMSIIKNSPSCFIATLLAYDCIVGVLNTVMLMLELTAR